MIRLAEKIKNYLELEFENAFLWAPVAMGLGILFYFRLPLDPSFTLVVMMLAAAIGCFLLCRNKFYLSYLSFAFLLFAINLASFNLASLSTLLIANIRPVRENGNGFIGKVALYGLSWGVSISMLIVALYIRK